MKIVFDSNAFARMKSLFVVASSDQFRQALSHVHWNAEDKRFEVTDGHVLRLESWADVGATIEGEEATTLPVDSFLFSGLDFKASFKIAARGGHFVTLEVQPATPGDYPRVSNVLANLTGAGKEEAWAAFTGEGLTALVASMKWFDNSKVLRFVNGSHRLAGVRVYRGEVLAGVICPPRWNFGTPETTTTEKAEG